MGSVTALQWKIGGSIGLNFLLWMLGLYTSESAMRCLAAMDMALAYFDKARDVSKECKGWDIEALDARGVIYIEVKGLSGPSVNVELTPNEYLKMGEHKDRYVLFVVTSALTQSRRGRAFRWQQAPTSGLDIWSTAQGEVIKIEPLTGARCSL